MNVRNKVWGKKELTMKKKPKRKQSAIRRKTYHCGPQNKKAKYIEVAVFEYTETTQPRRKRREYVTTPKQKNLNDRHARHHFCLLVKSNFDDGDLLVTLTYHDNKRPPTIKDAEHEVKLFLDRLGTLYKKYGKGKVDYIYVTEEGKKSGKIHHHVLLKNVGISREEIEEKWHKKGLGFANSKRLRANDNGIEQLANYLNKEASGKKRWKNSKDLIRPWVSTSDGRYSHRKIEKLAVLPTDCEVVKNFWEKEYPDYVLYECQHYFNPVTTQWSIYLKMRLRR